MSLPKYCDENVFNNGKSLLAADTSECRSVGFDPWVIAISEASGQPVDWHYSGGVAHVLFIGDRAKVVEAAKGIPCPARIMRWFEEGDPGLYRSGVSVVSSGTIGAFYEGGKGSAFIVSDEKGD